MDIETYQQIRMGRAGFYEQKRGLIEVHGKEAVQFLDGMITNDMKTLEDGGQMLAAFPNAHGRLTAVVRVQRRDESYFIETEDATKEKLFQGLFRFTFAGDFFVEDLSEQFSYFDIFGPVEDVYHQEVGQLIPGGLAFEARHGASYFVPAESAEKFRSFLEKENGCLPVDDELYETLRIESGIPKFGVDMDETTIVPELGLNEMISYNKGCYVGQEIIARIHFRGHVAKKLAGLIFKNDLTMEAERRLVGSVPDNGIDLLSSDGKNAGKITSFTYSPKLDTNIALAFVRYDYLAAGTEVHSSDGIGRVVALPFVF